VEVSVPTISRFFGIAIRMYFDEHAPPHFHAYYSGAGVARNSSRWAIAHSTTSAKARRGRAPSVTSSESMAIAALGTRGYPSTVAADRTAGIGATMHTVSRVEVREGYRLHVEFTDGVAGEIDLSDRLFGPVFEPLRSRELFRRVGIDEFGVITWPNGADLAPDALHRRLSHEKVAEPSGQQGTR
jgi:uncharacterized protein DUF2442/uncharacterized protein DUF4160